MHINEIITQNKLNEALDNPYPFKLEGPRADGAWRAEAKTDVGPLGMDFDGDENQDVFTIDFRVNNRVGTEGTGDEFRIFATVVAIMNEWISKINIERVQRIGFSAEKQQWDNDGRTRLYARFAKILAKRLGWKVKKSATFGGKSDFFSLENPNPQTNENFAKASVTEEVSIPENIFHMKNRLLKVKKITDAMGNRPIMFRTFVYDADRVEKIIKKVTNDTGRKIKTGSNQKQQEVLQKLGIKNPTFAALASGKHANVGRDSLESHAVAGLQNIFIPISNEIYYSDTVSDLGMGRSAGATSKTFDVDKAVDSYKKGWPPAGFDNEIIVDTDKYYLLNLQSFLLELTSPDIKDQIKRLKREYNKSYSSKASENQVDDILKDLFKTKIISYSDISRWIQSVAIPFVDMIASSSVQENFADGKKKGKSRPGRVKRSGASCNGSVTELRAKAKKASGEKAKMYHWCANMKAGRKK